MTDDASPLAEHEAHAEQDGCSVCHLDHAFEMPGEIVEAAHRRSLVIFAGAGISTEVPAVFPHTLYETIREMLGSDQDATSFPDLMSAFEERHGRPRLFRAIKRRFDYVDSFTRPHNAATAFHSELATMPYIEDILTTNWDTYFERLCNATPLVTGRDYAFHDMARRRVYKIHGSISNPSSMVATQEDYARRLDDLRGNAIGGSLRQLLATMTVVFIGYSLRDWNFREIYTALLDDLGELAPRRYLVSPFPGENTGDFSLLHVCTSGTRFLRDLKAALVGDCFFDDSLYEHMEALRERVWEAYMFASELNASEYPLVVHCWSYQCGLLDVCDRVRRLRSSGEYSDRQHVIGLFRLYEELFDAAIDDGRFWDAAYIDGYMKGLFVIAGRSADIMDRTPLYLCFGSDSPMRQRRSLIVALNKGKSLDEGAWEEALELSQGIPDGMVLPHMPFLPNVPGTDW